ncbi:type I polyketide synthase [Streptomyces guryensis]|uniref:Type I polyketide synthase n=1 Tax=Streptomyces guryensis TaxID=2886947 RepID=A0A9Q3VXS6_9ACTN|nr:type I polyketide synthase [Streptomyces guryensis]MCD9878920.1 type I polyketide synthase [Streptomyces guryensis]
MTDAPHLPLAVVGMAGRFPSAPDLDSFWKLLMERGDAIRPVPEDRWDTSVPLDPELPVQSVGGFIDGVQDFDPTFFGISPREAASIDPQQRLMLEIGWRALEDAGIRAADLAGSRTGVYVGALWHDYEVLRKDRGAPATQHSAFGNANDMIATRLSYFLGLRGPSLTVETGCSASLVALHLAAQALLAGEIDAAIVGGTNLMLTPDLTVGLTHFGGLSDIGRCQAFSVSADGYVRGEGIAALCVKTLERALRDGDRIHGVIAHSVVNNDGGGESLVTPDPAGQEDLLRQGYASAAVPVDEIAYIEAHGTGTGRGDPVEASAIGRVLGRARRPGSGPLPIGSVKSNVGHLEATAGLAGVVKALLSMKHGVVPPSLHSETLNPAIDFEDLNVTVVREPLPLPQDTEYYMGVSSFGWGGTNAHVILRTPPALQTTAEEPAQRDTLSVFLSAQGRQALTQRAREVGAALPGAGDPHGVAGTLARRRDHFADRVALVADDAQQAAELLARFAEQPEEEIPGLVTGRARKAGRTAFVFPGQGTQWAGMARELFARDAVFAATVNRCADALAPYVDWDLIGIVSGEAGDTWLDRVDMLQPTLWAVSVGLAEVWRASGVEPDVVVGHSQGEVGAATVAGILSYPDAAMIVARRSALARRTSGRGLMLAVDLDVQGARAALEGFEESVSLAVNNGPRSCVLSGEKESVLVLKELLEADDVYCRLVNVDYASHSPQMDELEDDLLAALGTVEPRAGSVPLMSTVRAAVLEGPEMNASYWVDNLRQPVVFADAMQALFADGVTHVIEVSGHPVLVPAVEELAQSQGDPARVLPTLRRHNGTVHDLRTALSRAYVAGLEPFGNLPRHSWEPVPGYPWQRRPYWVEQGRRRGTPNGEMAFTLTPSVAEQDSWEGGWELGRDDTPWLKDHQVYEAVVLPATAMTALAFDTARARTGATPRVLSDVDFRQDLTLGDEPHRLSVRWQEDVKDGGTYTLLSLAEGATSWATHARSRVFYTAPPAAGHHAPDFPERLAGGQPVGVEEFYAAQAARGLRYGPAFQGLRSLRVDGREALGDVLLPERCRAAARSHGLHPALWDAALQVSLALYPQDSTVVPRSVRRVELLQEPAEPVTEVWSHALLREDGEVDLHLYDSARRPLLTMKGLVMEALAVTAGGPDEIGAHTYGLDFVEQPWGAMDPSPGTWAVVLGAADDAAPELSGALIAAGAPEPLLIDSEETGGEPYARLRGAGELAGVAFLAPGDDLAAQRRGLLALTELVRVCAARPVPPRLVVVTSGAQPVTDAAAIDAGAALYWGFGRVLRQEHPELRSLLLDVVRTDPGWQQDCVAELLTADDAEDQVALRAGRRFAGRLTHGEPEPSPVLPAWTRPDPAYHLAPERPGVWEGLMFRPLVRRAPAAGELEIEVTASALNFLDVMKALGTFPDPRGADLLGIECAGVVTRVGEGVTDLTVGRRVITCALPAHASHITVRADHVQPVPSNWSDEEAVSLPIAMATAWYALQDVARLQAGETVLIHSAAGGLGLAAVQIARLAGAEVIATAGTADKRAHLKELGIRHVFDSRRLDWAQEVRAATDGKGVDVLLNSLAGAAIPLGLDLLAEGGRFVEVGKRDIYSEHRVSLAAFKKGISLASVDIAAMMDRRPERFARLLRDVWSVVSAGDVTPLPVVRYPMAQAAEAMRAMSQGSHIGKFVLAVDPDVPVAVAPQPMRQGRLRADATYLITGGLGGLGLSLAEFMADRGAGALVLLGRSAPDAEALARIEDLRENGVRVDTHRVDVTDAEAVHRTLAQIRAELPALRGVVHAAGLLDDATVRTLEAGQLARVLAPKVDGARHLDAATAQDPLDFFVLFSSVASLVGLAGQAAYSAGNAYLDALAAQRRRRGLPALSVQWGPFSDVGLAAREDARGSRLAERGMGGLTTDEAWPALVQYLDTGHQVVSYVRLDVRQWLDSYPDTASKASWSTLLAEGPGATRRTAGAGQFLVELLAVPDGERLPLIEAQVRELAGRVLRLETAAVEREAPFKELGLDSLLSLEFRNRLEGVFALKLSPTLLWTYGNVRALSVALSERLAQAAELAATGTE